VPSLKWRLIDGLRVFHLPGGTRLVENLTVRTKARRSATEVLAS
jgi:hypothetical protein